jgi:hypothetical protein
MQADLPPSAGMARFGPIEIAEAEVRRLSSFSLVERLVDRGVSRLSAERIVAIEFGTAEPGRARAHAQARRGAGA